MMRKTIWLNKIITSTQKLVGEKNQIVRSAFVNINLAIIRCSLKEKAWKLHSYGSKPKYCFRHCSSIVIFNMLCKPKYKDLCFIDWERKKGTQRYDNLLIRWKHSKIIELGEVNTSQCKMEQCYCKIRSCLLQRFHSSNTTTVLPLEGLCSIMKFGTVVSEYIKLV